MRNEEIGKREYKERRIQTMKQQYVLNSFKSSQFKSLGNKYIVQQSGVIGNKEF